VKYGDKHGLVVCPTGKALAWGEWRTQPIRTTVRLWDLPSGRERVAWKQPYPEVEPLAFSPDGRTLFIWDRRADTIQLWELATSKLRSTLRNVGPSHGLAAALHPGGRMLALANRKDSGVVKVWDVATGVPWAELKVDNDEIKAVAFSADCNTFAVAEGPDTAIRVWDTTGFWKARPPLKEKLSQRDFDSLWQDLAGGDAARAYHAIWCLAGAPRQAVPWIGQRLRPVAEADAKRTALLIADLDSDRLAVRDKAMRELGELAETALPALQKKLTARPSLEARRRIEALLAKLEQPAALPEQLRVLRAIEVLEHAGTPEARQVLEKLAGGVPQALRTRQSRASLDRLARRFPR
jgi:hypothetical protein